MVNLKRAENIKLKRTMKSGFGLCPIRIRENMIFSSCRTISMLIYALDPISVIRFLSVIQESLSLDGSRSSALGVRSQKLSKVLNGQL
jgi:hypothetical protein